MRLTQYTDYSLRVLIYLAMQPNDKLSNIKDIAEQYHISKNHLMKVTYDLGQLGFIQTVRGRNGGIRLALKPEDINIGAVVRKTEEDFHMVECFDREKNACILSPSCKLKHVLYDAVQAFLQVLDGYTLADIAFDQGLLELLVMRDRET